MCRACCTALHVRLWKQHSHGAPACKRSPPPPRRKFQECGSQVSRTRIATSLKNADRRKFQECGSPQVSRMRIAASFKNVKVSRREAKNCPRGIHVNAYGLFMQNDLRCRLPTHTVRVHDGSSRGNDGQTREGARQTESGANAKEWQVTARLGQSTKCQYRWGD